MKSGQEKYWGRTKGSGTNMLMITNIICRLTTGHDRWEWCQWSTKGIVHMKIIVKMTAHLTIGYHHEALLIIDRLDQPILNDWSILWRMIDQSRVEWLINPKMYDWSISMGMIDQSYSWKPRRDDSRHIHKEKHHLLWHLGNPFQKVGYILANKSTINLIIVVLVVIEENSR